jgi:hypothetical protein
MKHLKNIAVFIICLTGLYYGIFYMMFNIKIQNKLLVQHFDNRIPMKKSILSKALLEWPNNEKFDFIFLGSSHCYRGLDPYMFSKEGFNTYNLGGSSQTPANALPLLKRFIYQTKNVVLEVYPVVFGIEPTEAYYDILTASNNINLLYQSASNVESFKAFNLLALKPFINLELSKDTLKKCYYHRGFTTVSDSAIKRKVEYKDIILNKKWLNKQFIYLNEIKNLCKKNNVNLILVYAPIPQKLRLINETDYYTKLYTFLNQNPDVKFFNYGRNHNLNDGFHFYDDDHLNSSGVKLFNQIFIHDLKQNAVLSN